MDEQINGQPSLLESGFTSAVYAPKILEQMIVQGGRALLGIFTVPAELMLHPRFGTQAIHPITWVLGFVVSQLVGLGSFFVPGRGIDGWTIHLAVLILSVLHALRLRPLIFNMELEADGEYDGPSWSFYYRLPFGSDLVIRCIYEPLTVILLPLALYVVGLCTPFAAIYLAVVGFCLAVRSMLRFFEVWTYVRDMRNAKSRAEMMRLFVEGRLPIEQTARILATGFPASLSADVRGKATSAVVEAAFASLKSQKAKPATA